MCVAVAKITVLMGKLPTSCYHKEGQTLKGLQNWDGDHEGQWEPSHRTLV